MNDQEIDKLLERLDSIASDYDCELGLPIQPPLPPTPSYTSTQDDVDKYHAMLRQAVRDWMFGQSEYFSILSGKLAIVIPEEWIDKELE